MKQLPKRSGEYLSEMIMRRYETRSTIMNSNRRLEDWGKLIGDVPSASAILDRFLHHAEIIRITGKSYRLRNQKDATVSDSRPAKAPSGSDQEKPDSKPAKAPSGSKDKTKEAPEGK